MKRVHTLSLIGMVSASLFIGSAAQASSLPEHVETDLVAICKAIKDNNQHDIYRAVKKSRISYRALDEGLVCNGQDMFSFAATHSADASNDFLARKVRRDPRVLTAKR